MVEEAEIGGVGAEVEAKGLGKVNLKEMCRTKGNVNEGRAEQPRR